MTSIRELTRLQSIDADLASTRTQLEEVERELSDTAALEELRERMAEQRQIAGQLERQLRAAETEVEGVRSHVATEEEKLYGGSVRNPKELIDLQHEITSLKARQSQHEEAALEIMTRFEAETARTEELGRELASMEAERRDLEERFTAQKARLEGSIAGLTERREQVAGQVPTRDLSLYHNLLNIKGGRAVSRVERAICQGCRTSLPMAIQQRVRAQQVLVQCPSCGRILYME